MRSRASGHRNTMPALTILFTYLPFRPSGSAKLAMDVIGVERQHGEPGLLRPVARKSLRR